MLKRILKSVLPKKVLGYLINLKNSRKTTEEIFTEIYDNKLWGASPDGSSFCSGSGTIDPNVELYKSMLVDFINKNSIKTIFEIGCGDFTIMKAVLQKTKVHYTGVDIVKSVIDHLNQKYADEGLCFKHLNAIEAPEFPKADLCIIRQVLQHLSNDQIIEILSKTNCFKFLLITEHLPSNPDIKNADKSPNGNIRLQNRQTSGVFLEDPPFSMNAKTVLSYKLDDENYQGNVIPAALVTSLIKN